MKIPETYVLAKDLPNGFVRIETEDELQVGDVVFLTNKSGHPQGKGWVSTVVFGGYVIELW